MVRRSCESEDSDLLACWGRSSIQHACSYELCWRLASNGLLATAVTLFLASTVVITKFFGWAIPHQDHPVVFIAATIMMLVGMDTVIRDVNTARSKETKVRGVLQAHDRLEFIQPPTGDF